MCVCARRVEAGRVLQRRLPAIVMHMGYYTDRPGMRWLKKK